MPPVECDPDYQGDLTLLATTVVYKANEPSHGFAVGETSEGKRVVGVTHDKALMSRFETEQCVGQVLAVNEQGVLS